MSLCSLCLYSTVGERKTSYQFAIHTESQWNKRSEWVIAAQSDREMKEWIDAFKVKQAILVFVCVYQYTCVCVRECMCMYQYS